jgi:hypothetical protein
MFEADLATAGETWQHYELGEDLMPVFKCLNCENRIESRYFTWAQDMTEMQKTRRVRATILRPRCRCGNSRQTIPVTFRPTKWPHYSDNSANTPGAYIPATVVQDARGGCCPWKNES